MWRDVFQSLVNWYPIKVNQNEFPLFLQPVGGAVAVAGSGVSIATFQIPGDAYVEIYDWRGTSSAVTTSTQQGGPLGFNCQIYWGSREIQLTQGPTPGELIFGSAMQPGVWPPRPWQIAMPTGGFSSMLIDITNTLTTTNTINLVLAGWRRKR